MPGSMISISRDSDTTIIKKCKRTERITGTFYVVPEYSSSILVVFSIFFIFFPLRV